jgi:subtilisin family serine protease
MARESDRSGRKRRTGPGALPAADPRRQDFEPGNMDSSVIAIPLLRDLRADMARKRRPGERLPEYDVIIDLNLEFPGGRAAARDLVLGLLEDIAREGLGGARGKAGSRGRAIIEAGLEPMRSTRSDQYLFGRLDGKTLMELVRRDRFRKAGGKMEPMPPSPENMARKGETYRAIYHVWPDFKVGALMDRSVRTVKADAARYSFSAVGEGMVWAVVDSGIDASHPHFRMHGNLEGLEQDVAHRDFTGGDSPLTDEFGHGTHVAGIIAGEVADGDLTAFAKHRDERGEVRYQKAAVKAISGMAPKCRLLSLKVLDGEGNGKVSGLIAALDHIQEINGNGRRLRVHGVNMSLGYAFDPEWFACGQSPLCVEVDRLVRTGVAVVVAAGNTGYAYVHDAFKGRVASGMDLSINDPGNSQLAITVGATHKDMPHIYGVSYFSSKGPTGDGRLKPDLVAPGEKILSCAAGRPKAAILEETGEAPDYREHSGTSMAAPHVSGVIAAFLSVRREFIGQPERVKDIFLSTATDLRRERYFQGHGLVDLMRAIQSV